MHGPWGIKLMANSGDIERSMDSDGKGCTSPHLVGYVTASYEQDNAVV